MNVLYTSINNKSNYLMYFVNKHNYNYKFRLWIYYIHVKWVPCHHGISHPQLWMEEMASRYGGQLRK
jgi:hypothetical protein